MTAQRNAFAIDAACAHLVKAYKAVTAEYLVFLPGLDIRVSKAAPTTFDELYVDVREMNALRISPEHSATAIYGEAGNIAFRTMHDLGHVCHMLDFTLAGEVALFHTQWARIEKHLPSDQRRLCRAIYDADTTLMSLYEAKHGEFPKDQTAFILAAIQYLLV